MTAGTSPVPMRSLNEWGDLEDPKGKQAPGNGAVTNLYNRNPGRFRTGLKAGGAFLALSMLFSLARLHRRESGFDPVPRNLKDGELVVLYCGG